MTSVSGAGADGPRSVSGSRIGIDARLLAYRSGGISQHVRRLVDGLARQARQDAERDQFIVLEHRRGRRKPGAAGGPDQIDAAGGADVERIRRRFLWTPPHHRLEGWTLPVELAPLGLGLFHATDMVLPKLWRGRSVVTVHDLAFLDQPGLLTDDSRQYYGAVAASAERANAVITVSEHTRARLLAHTRVDPTRIRVIHNAIPDQYAAPAESGGDRAALEALGLGDTPYILFVGTIEPRKNLITLLDAYDRLSADGLGASLVLAGADGWLSTPVYERARTMGPNADVRFLGFVPDPALPALYRGASALAHPAVDEGFGMTVAEAMAAGTPVVAANAGSLPEVAGAAALLVPPTQPEAWVEGLRRILTDTELANDLRARGRRQAARFSVAAMAAATLAAYREVLAAPRPSR